MQITEIAPGIHRIEYSLGVRRIAQWVAVGGSRKLLFDTGVDTAVGEHISPALSSMGIQLEDITDLLVSHADVDHYGGNGEFRRAAPGVRMRASAEDRPLVESWQTILDQRYGWYEQHGLGYDAESMAWLQGAAGADTPLDGVVTEGELIDLGDLLLEVMFLPGHTAGHIGLLNRESECAIVADAVLERGLYDLDGRLISPPPYVTASGYRATAEKLLALDLNYLETAHYPSMTGDDIAIFLNETIEFIDRLQNMIEGVLADGPKSIAEITATVDSRLGPFTAMAHELARSVAAHLEEMEMRGEATREAGSNPPRWLLT